MQEQLESLLYDYDKTVLFVGIGNVLLSDDGVGVYISQRLKEQGNIKILTVEVSIENYIKKINDFKASTIILLDSANFSREPGYACLLPVSKVLDFTTTTHNISLKNVSKFFTANVLVLGIQPQSVSFGEKLSEPVKKVADKIIRLINAAFIK